MTIIANALDGSTARMNAAAAAATATVAKPAALSAPPAAAAAPAPVQGYLSLPCLASLRICEYLVSVLV